MAIHLERNFSNSSTRFLTRLSFYWSLILKILNASVSIGFPKNNPESRHSTSFLEIDYEFSFRRTISLPPVKLGTSYDKIEKKRDIFIFKKKIMEIFMNITKIAYLRCPENLQGTKRVNLLRWNDVPRRELFVPKLKHFLGIFKYT